MTISVVVPVHNREDVIGRAITSVLRQRRGVEQIIVVDDGSTDATVLRARERAPGLVTVIPLQVKQGAAAARNAGIDASRGHVIAFLDSDDEWDPRYADALERRLDEHGPRIWVAPFDVTSGSRTRRGRPAVLRSRSPRRDVIAYRGGPFTCSAIAVNRPAVEAGARFDERLPALQDLDFVASALAAGARLVGTADVLVHKHRDASGPRVYNPENELAARRLLLAKYESVLRDDPKALRRHHVRLLLAAHHLDDREVVTALRRTGTLPTPYRWLSRLSCTAPLAQFHRAASRLVDV